jgi:hypothetical protein
MKSYCRACGGMLKPGWLWDLFPCIYCKQCKRISHFMEVPETEIIEWLGKNKE